MNARRSCLEIYSMDGTQAMPYGRHQQMLRSYYQRENQYAREHPNALADDSNDIHGKGTGVTGADYWLPDCRGELGIFRTDDFDTRSGFNPGASDRSVNGGPGNVDDREARRRNMTISLYSASSPYGEGSVDTSMNVADGQYVLGMNTFIV